jgi:hypothetical protein
MRVRFRVRVKVTVLKTDMGSESGVVLTLKITSLIRGWGTLG